MSGLCSGESPGEAAVRRRREDRVARRLQLLRDVNTMRVRVARGWDALELCWVEDMLDEQDALVHYRRPAFTRGAAAAP